MKAINLTGRAPGGARRRLAEVLPLDTPIVVQVFPVYACNFKCSYCIFSVDRSRHGFISDQITMGVDLFRKAVDDLAAFPRRVKVLRFVGIGEPLLHPGIADMIRYAADKRVADTIELLTNGSLLTADMADALVSSGLSRLVVSLQGTSSDAYRRVCGRQIDFEAFVANLKYFYERRGKVHVYVKIVDVALDGPADEGRFFDLFGDICDTIAVEQAVPIHSGLDFNAALAQKDQTQFGLPVGEVTVCPQPFFTMQINPDGKVVPCYSFEYPGIMGDCSEQSLSDIWGGAAFGQFRLECLSGRKAAACDHCQIIKYRFFPEDELGSDAERLRRLYEPGGMDGTANPAEA